MSTATGSSREGRSTGRGKGKEASRAGSPVADLEDMDPAAQQPAQPDDSAKGRKKKVVAPAPVEEEEEETLPEGLKESDKLIFAIRQATSKLYKENGNKMPSNADIAEELGEDEATVESARKSLTLARQGQKLSGLRKSALKSGFSRRQGASRAEVKGLDIEQSLITPSDIARLAHAIPLNFDKGSYEASEVEMRTELIHESLPMGAAREIIAFVEPLFRGVMTEAVDRQFRLKTSRITPSTMNACLKKYNDLGVFTACVPPKGLVRYGKEHGVDLVKRGDESKGWLMNVSDEDKKQWKKDKAENKQAKKMFDDAKVAEEERKAAKKRPADGEDAEVEAPAAPPKKKKKRAAVA